MHTFFQSYFSQHPGFQSQDKIVYQKDLVHPTEFEKNYLELRKKEGRLYSNEEILNLPEVIPSSSSNKEWNIRRHSAGKLVAHLKRRKPDSILEVGCGNGWLIRHLNKDIKAEFCGIDINEWELLQARQVSSNQNCFVYADIFSPSLNDLRTQVVILASSLQYFPDLDRLINRLLSLLYDGGEIHILDTPFYSRDNSVQAQQRSKEYFTKHGATTMNHFYYHHSWQDLAPFKYEVLYDPRNLLNGFRKKLGISSPFPWICITR